MQIESYIFNIIFESEFLGEKKLRAKSHEGEKILHSISVQLPHPFLSPNTFWRHLRVIARPISVVPTSQTHSGYTQYSCKYRRKDLFIETNDEKKYHKSSIYDKIYTFLNKFDIRRKLPLILWTVCHKTAKNHLPKTEFSDKKSCISMIKHTLVKYR
jgi:hypothetical protein